MYNKQEASAVRQQFWTRFGQYMAPVPSVGGEKVHWINYKTEIKGIFFKMNADNNRAYVAVEINVGDAGLQQKYFETFLQFKKPFEVAAGKDWEMRQHFITEDGKEIARISAELNGVNIFRESDWPVIISFLKIHVMGLDAFWSEFKGAFG